MPLGPRDLVVFARAAWRPERPDRLVRAAVAAAMSGPTVVGAFAAATARYPRATAIIDPRGALSYVELWRASDAAARRLRADGVGPGTVVGLLCPNDRGFVIAMVAVARLGADLVLLNTGFAGPQLAEATRAESVRLLVHDDDLSDIVAGCDVDRAFTTSELEHGGVRFGRPLSPVLSEGRWVILTSGTTGRPKGAGRSGRGATASATALMAAIPIRARDTVVIAPPLFHAWGLAHLGLALSLSSTVVLAPVFDAAATLASLTAHDADGLIVVPTMLQRMLAVATDEDGAPVPSGRSHLRYIASSGSDLGAGLATRAMTRFGPVVYNVYGSTEAAIAAIATPADLAVEPATVGRPAASTVVRVVDTSGREVPSGTIGRVVVGSDATFSTYTDGTTRPRVDGLVATGDLGRVDADGRLFIVGREDDLIITGGENVQPTEIEECLRGHPGVDDVAVVGVDDDDLGQRLEAYVVRRKGQSLEPDDVRSHVRTRLARFKVPAAVTFVERIPRTSTGKIRRAEVADRPSLGG